MGKQNVTVYKYADNEFGYEKQYLTPSEFKTCDPGWHRLQADAINDAPSWTIEKATKAELADYAKENHDVVLDQTKKVGDLRAEVTALFVAGATA